MNCFITGSVPAKSSLAWLSSVETPHDALANSIAPLLHFVWYMVGQARRRRVQQARGVWPAPSARATRRRYGSCCRSGPGRGCPSRRALNNVTQNDVCHAFTQYRGYERGSRCAPLFGPARRSAREESRGVVRRLKSRKRCAVGASWVWPRMAADTTRNGLRGPQVRQA